MVGLLQEAVTSARGVATTRADQHDIRSVNGRLDINDPTRLSRTTGLHVVLSDIKPLNDYTTGRRERALNLPAFPFIFPRDYQNLIPSFDVHSYFLLASLAW